MRALWPLLSICFLFACTSKSENQASLIEQSQPEFTLPAHWDSLFKVSFHSDQFTDQLLHKQEKVLREIDSMLPLVPPEQKNALQAIKGEYNRQHYRYLTEFHKDLSAGKPYLEAARQLALLLNDSVLMVDCLDVESHFQFIHGQAASAINLRLRATEITKALGDTTWTYILLRRCFKMLYSSNRYTESLKLIEHSIPFSRMAKNGNGEPTQDHLHLCLKYAARSLLKLGEYDSVAAIIDSIDAYSRTHFGPHSQVDHLHLLIQWKMAIGNYAEAIDICHQALKRSEDLGWKIGIFKSHQRLAQMKEYLKEYPQAKKHYLKALPYLEGQPYGNKKIHFYADLGRFYMREGILDSSLMFLNKAYRLNQDYAPPLVGVNLYYGIALYNTGKYSEAEEIFNRIRSKAHLKQEVMIYCYLSKVNAKQSRLDKAYDLAFAAYQGSARLSYLPVIQLAQENMSEMASANQNYRLAHQAALEARETHDSIGRLENKKAAIHQSYRYAYEKKATADSVQFANQQKINELKLAEETARSTLLSQQNKTKNTQLVLLLLVVAALGSITILIRQKRKREVLLNRKKHEVLQLKAQRERQQREVVENDLRNIRKDLKESINQLLLQEKRNAELKEMLEDLRYASKNAMVKTKTKIIQRKLGQFNLEDNLNEIREKAQRAYPEFYDYLENTLSSRSKTEILYCVLLFSGYSHDDISRTLQRSDKAIRSLRYRIRKKFGLDENMDLEAFLSKKAA